MGFNSGFKGLIYIVHVVGYFHSCTEMLGIMYVFIDRKCCKVNETHCGNRNTFLVAH